MCLAVARVFLGHRTSHVLDGCNKHGCFDTVNPSFYPPFLPLSGGIHPGLAVPPPWCRFPAPFVPPSHPTPRVVTSTKFTTVKRRTKGSMARLFSISIGANARHARWADSFRAFEGYLGLPIPTTRATNVPWNGSMENRVPWRCAR